MILLIYEVKFTNMNSQIHRDRKQNGCCQGLRGEGNGDLVFNGQRFSVWEDEKVLEMDSGDGHMTTYNVLNVTELYS